MTQVVDIVGQTFGDLKVVSRAGSNGERQAVWVVLCACGKETKASGRELRTKGRTDCGKCADEPAEHDWAVIEIDGMKERIDKACFDIEHRYHRVVDFDDLEQEAHVLLASNGVRVRNYLADPEQGWSHVSRWLWSRLANVAVAETDVQSQQIDYDLLRDE